MTGFYLWRLIAGVAMFLLGMTWIEESLHTVAGRSFKLFLKRTASNRIKAITGGVLITGVLQSSSVVNTMIMAFVGARVLSLPNAMAIVLGDNLGTTVDSWFLATAGFRLNLGSIGFIFTGIAGIASFLLNKDHKLYSWSNFFLGIGFLFLGLDFMKTAMVDITGRINMEEVSRLGSFPLLIFGLVLTALIQSSSVTIALLLSAIYAHGISLYTGCAVVLGAEIGTTLKFLLASVRGSSGQKRIAFGNFIFNVIMSLIGLIFLGAIVFFIHDILQIKNDLIGLVFFQSFINLCGIIIFYPLLPLYAGLLERLFNKSEEPTFYIHQVTPANVDLALDAFEKETFVFIGYVVIYCNSILDGKKSSHVVSPLHEKFDGLSITAKYDFIKQLHGKLLAYYLQLQHICTNSPDIIKTNQLMGAVRNSMYAAKSMKDAIQDAQSLKNSSNDMKYNLFTSTGESSAAFYERIRTVLLNTNASESFTELSALLTETQEGYAATLKKLYSGVMISNLSEIEISSIINFKRQVYTALKSIILAVKDAVLNEKDAEYFENLPGFIH